jgi:vacuolar-type H+-ATPase subunit H
MDELDHSPEAEVSRAMEQVLAVERSVSSTIREAEDSALAQRRAATEQAQRIIERVEQRLTKIHRDIDFLLREEIARLQAEASLTVDHYPDLEPPEEELQRLAMEAAAWLTSNGNF